MTDARTLLGLTVLLVASCGVRKIAPQTDGGQETSGIDGSSTSDDRASDVSLDRSDADARADAADAAGDAADAVNARDAVDAADGGVSQGDAGATGGCGPGTAFCNSACGICIPTGVACHIDTCGSGDAGTPCGGARCGTGTLCVNQVCVPA